MDDRPILLCYDGSPGAVKAIEAAAGLLGPRRAVVVFVLPRVTAAESVAMTSSVVASSAFEDLNSSEAERVASQGVEIARSAGFDAEPRGKLANRTWEGIVSVADELDVAMIVIGSRGRSGLQEILDKGSASHEVAQHAGRPVLIVPPAHDSK